MTNTSTFLHLFQIYFNSSQVIECAPNNIRRKTYTSQALFALIVQFLVKHFLEESQSEILD